MLVSMAIMYQNGQASQRMSPPLFLSLLTLFNFYVILIAHLYSPVTGDESEGSENYDIPTAEKERRQIMNAFYETEMKKEDHAVNETVSYDEETDSLATGLTSHRRDIKRPQREKAKDKIWESIVSQVEREAQEEGSSSDDDERI